MAEWRTFFEVTDEERSVSIWKILDIKEPKESNAEVRTDLYISTFSPFFGVKLRNKTHLEVKLCSGTDDVGIEMWAKVVHERYKHSDDFVYSDLHDIIKSHHLTAYDQYKDVINKQTLIAGETPTTTLPTIQLEKHRHQKNVQNVCVEQTEIYVVQSDGSHRRFRSICFEGQAQKMKALLQSAQIEKHYLPLVENFYKKHNYEPVHSHSTPLGKIAFGYPHFVHLLLQTHQHYCSSTTTNEKS